MNKRQSKKNEMNAAHNKNCMVITDPKGKLNEAVRESAEEKGYSVKTFNVNDGHRTYSLQ